MTREEIKKALIENPMGARNILEIKNFLKKYHNNTREARYAIVNDLPPFYKNPCSICGKPTKFRTSKDGYAKTCSLGCEKIQRANTNMKRYGTVNTFQNDDIKEKIRQTNMKRYGVENPSQSDEIQSQKYQNARNIEFWEQKFGIPADQLNNLFDGSNCFTVAKRIEEITGQWHDQKTLRRYVSYFIPEYKEIESNTYIELGVMEFLDEYGIEYYTKNRSVISPKELDFYIPKHKLAIEMNGIYHHSVDTLKGKSSRLYHKNKFLDCKNKNITLLQFTDYEWNNNREIVKNIIKSKLGLTDRLYARKCDVVDVTDKDSESFQSRYHIQGYRTARHNIGLEYNGELVALMTFSKHITYDWELIRYCSRDTVVGGFSRLIKNFQKDHPGSVFSYSNSNFSVGNVYQQNGFEYLGDTEPSYFWTNGKEIRSRQSVQKKKLGYQETEFEYMTKQGYYRYFDAGNEKWLLK